MNMQNIMNWAVGPLFAALLGVATGASAQEADNDNEGSQTAQTAASPAGRIDLNTATVNELTTLPGIGPAKAAAIVAYREQHRFERVDDLVRVRGIGRATLRDLRDRITVSSSGSAPRTRRAR